MLRLPDMALLATSLARLAELAFRHIQPFQPIGVVQREADLDSLSPTRMLLMLPFTLPEEKPLTVAYR